MGCGGREKKQVNKPKPGKKSSTYTSDTVALKNDIFDCSKPEHAAAFEKSLKRVADYIRREGEKECVLMAEGLENSPCQ